MFYTQLNDGSRIFFKSLKEATEKVSNPRDIFRCSRSTYDSYKYREQKKTEGKTELRGLFLTKEEKEKVKNFIAENFLE